MSSITKDVSQQVLRVKRYDHHKLRGKTEVESSVFLIKVANICKQPNE